MPTSDFFPDQAPEFENIPIQPPPKKNRGIKGVLEIGKGVIEIGGLIGGFLGGVFGYKPDAQNFQDILNESEAQRKASERQQLILYGFIFIILIASIFAIVKITKK